MYAGMHTQTINTHKDRQTQTHTSNEWSAYPLESRNCVSSSYWQIELEALIDDLSSSVESNELLSVV